jgi:hypothetical protein
MDILIHIAPNVYKSYVMIDKKQRDETVTGTVPKCPKWYNGCKPTVLSQIHLESDECQIQNQPIRSLHSEQDCQWHTNGNMLSRG